MVMVTVLKLHGMSNLRIHEIVAMIYAISVTESAINRMILRMAREIGPLYEQIRKEVHRFPTCNGDESSWRVDGANHWLWVVVTKYAALYHMDKTRKTEVLKKMLGPEYEGVVGSDSRDAWNHAAVYPNIKTPSAASRHKSMKDDRIVSCVRFLENVASVLNMPSTLFMTDNTVSDRLQGSVTCSARRCLPVI